MDKWEVMMGHFSIKCFLWTFFLVFFFFSLVDVFAVVAAVMGGNVEAEKQSQMTTLTRCEWCQDLSSWGLWIPWTTVLPYFVYLWNEASELLMPQPDPETSGGSEHSSNFLLLNLSLEKTIRLQSERSNGFVYSKMNFLLFFFFFFSKRPFEQTDSAAFATTALFQPVSTDCLWFEKSLLILLKRSVYSH